MSLIVTTANYLNDTKEALDKVKENDVLCIVYNDDNAGLNVSTVDYLLNKKIEKRFICLNKSSETESAFELGYMIGKESDKEIVLLSDDDVFKMASQLLKTKGVQKEKKTTSKPNLNSIEPNKTPAKRGRKPKAKNAEIMNGVSA